MQLYCLSDREDTLVGMRLAGIDGVLLTQKDEVEQALTDVKANQNVGIVLITKSLASLARETVEDMKLHCSRPLLLEIPAPGEEKQSQESISRYIREAIGLKL